jgi:uncharacterized protein YraI
MSKLLTLLALPIGCLVGLAPAQAATPMVVTMTTWLHAGPGLDSTVLDEIGTGLTVDVLGCQGGWCQVNSDKALGYVQQVLLSSAAPQPPIWRPGPDCFPAQHFTAEGPLALTVCPSPAPAH